VSGAAPQAVKAFRAVIGISLAGISAMIFSVKSSSTRKLQFDFLNWTFFGVEKVHLLGTNNSGAKDITTEYHLGPVTFSTFRHEPDAPQAIGTNKVHVGDRLYDPISKREIWRVLAVERKHEFDDDTDRDGVLVRSSVNGGEAWMPREKLGKVLVGR
jgi:hypothetical protein